MSGEHPLTYLPYLGPYQYGASVAPSDTVDLATPARALMVGVAGDIVVITTGGSTITIASATVTAQGLLVEGIEVARVKNTGTTATGIVALW